MTRPALSIPLLTPIAAASLVLAGPVVAAVDAADVTGTLAVDPVRLVGGEEVPGVEELSIEHAGFRYLFADEESRAAFEADPERFEIQLGGACARMGPLSGVGTTDLYAVHDGRIYIFASEACRKGFLSAPEKLLETDDPLPENRTPERLAAGRALLERAVEAMGGAAAIDAVTSYDERVVGDERARGLTIVFPGSVRREQSWGDDTWASVVVEDEGWFEAPDGRRPMYAQQRRALERIAARNLLVILRARTCDDFVAVPDGPDRVRVAFGGFTCTLGLDPDSGRIASQSYRGRGGPRAVLGLVERTFSDFQTIEGVTLPRTIEVRHDGEPVQDTPTTLTTLTLNAPAAPGSFSRAGS